MSGKRPELNHGQPYLLFLSPFKMVHPVKTYTSLLQLNLPMKIIKQKF